MRPGCSYYWGYAGCQCLQPLVFQWDRATPGARAKCVGTSKPVDWGLIVPVAVCGALAAALAAGLAWLWFRLNRERLVKASGPPGESRAR